MYLWMGIDDDVLALEAAECVVNLRDVLSVYLVEVYVLAALIVSPCKDYP